MPLQEETRVDPRSCRLDVMVHACVPHCELRVKGPVTPKVTLYNASKNVWIRDLTEEGIEPNPGPGIISQNVDGLSTVSKLHQCFANILRIHKTAPISAAALQEHQINSSRAEEFDAEQLAHELRTCHDIRLFFIRREHTHLVEFVPEETRTKYAEVAVVSERGEAKLTPAFDRAIAAAKKAVEDAAAARAAHAAAHAGRNQQRGGGRRNRPPGGGGS